MIEYTLVIVIVGAAAFWLARQFVRWMRGTGSGCGGTTPARPKRTTLTVGGRSVH